MFALSERENERGNGMQINNVNAAAHAVSTTGTRAAGGAPGATNITGADFLTLLVSELKNQDPTQPTDPQAYVQQMVGVNSLEQLIQINQDLGGSASGNSSSQGTAGSSTTSVIG